MGLYRRFICKLKTAAPFQKSISLNAYSNSKWSRISEFFQPVSRNSVLQNVVKNNQRYNYKSPFLDGFFHNLNSRNVYRTFMLGGLVGCGAAYYYWHLERVPYTNRSHFVLLSTSYEKKLRESRTFEALIDSKYEGKRLPPLHPSSIRVQRIGKEIVEAAQKGLRKEEESLIIKIFKKLGKRDYHQIPQFEWEFVVVDNPIHCAFYYPGGKIVISTGWLDTFESDAEIAVGIAHEVGHAIARHDSEGRTRLPGLTILMLMFLYWTFKFHLIPAISKFVGSLTTYSERHSAQRVSKVWCPLISLILKGSLLCLTPAISINLIWLSYSRRRELEADYIGLILMAHAGYDPRVAPHAYEKIGSSSPWDDYVSCHPCGKTRAQKLSKPQAMEEALTIYREVQAQGGV